VCLDHHSATSFIIHFTHTKLTQIREERKLCLSVLQNGGKMLKARMDLSTCFLHLGSMLALSVMGAAQL
jgi:hypothetical protein